jgi:hypothetical protein
MHRILANHFDKTSENHAQASAHHADLHLLHTKHALHFEGQDDDRAAKVQHAIAKVHLGLHKCHSQRAELDKATAAKLREFGGDASETKVVVGDADLAKLFAID